jgi:hypothetical protein
MSTSEIADLDQEERWRAHPEQADFGWAHAFGLYFLLNIPDEESFDGYVSVGITGPQPDETPADHSPSVVLA